MNEGELVADLAGDLAQGTMMARAVEPGHGEAASAHDDGHTHESACLNCDTPLVGAYCHACGQGAHVHRTIGAFFHDLLHGVFHFEGKIWRTLPVLALHPGRLTREYIDGKRAKYVSPIALFLFSVFLLFASASQFGTGMMDEPAVETDGTTIAGLEANVAELERLEAERDRLAAQGADTAAVTARIAEREDAVAMAFLQSRGESTDLALRELDVEGTGSATIDHAIDRIRANPQLVAYQMQTYAYKYSWALVPVSVPFVWLLFALNPLVGRRRFGLYDHTVFVTYSISFVSLLVALAMALRALGVHGMAFACGPIITVHMYRQLRGAYGTGRFGAAWRMVALVAISLGALALVTLAQLMLAVGH